MSGGVPIKITTFRVTESADPVKSITVAFLYDGPGKDMPKEGIEIDVTGQEALQMSVALRAAYERWART